MTFRYPTREEIDALCEALGQGLSIRASCRRAGVSVHRYYEWKKEFEAYVFLDKLKADGWSFEAIEALVMRVERQRQEEEAR